MTCVATKIFYQKQIGMSAPSLDMHYGSAPAHSLPASVEQARPVNMLPKQLSSTATLLPKKTTVPHALPVPAAPLPHRAVRMVAPNQNSITWQQAPSLI